MQAGLEFMHIHFLEVIIGKKEQHWTSRLPVIDGEGLCVLIAVKSFYWVI